LARGAALRDPAASIRRRGVRAIRLNPLAPIAAVWSVMSAVCGTHIEVSAPDSLVLMHIY
jgi:hypothetical protein